MSVIDGTNLVVGRAATQIAKRILKGEKIELVNAEKMIFTGRKEELFEKFNERFIKSVKGNPHKGPKYSRMPDRIVKRAIRGMVPWKRATGKDAMKNLRVHIGVPEQFAGAKLEKMEKAENKLEKGFSTVGNISMSLGAKW